MAKTLKVGVQVGGGPGTGFLWHVNYLTVARKEAMAFLSEEQYQHVVDQFCGLASESDPTRPVTVEVQAIESFYEMKDKGGILGQINLRVFFVVDKATRTILVLGSIIKSAEGQTPSWIKRRIQLRIRRLSLAQKS